MSSSSCVTAEEDSAAWTLCEIVWCELRSIERRAELQDPAQTLRSVALQRSRSVTARTVHVMIAETMCGLCMVNALASINTAPRQ